MSCWFLYLEYLDIATSGDVYLRSDTSDQLLDVGIGLFSQYLGIGPNIDSPSDGIGGGKGGSNDAEDGAAAKPASVSGTRVVLFAAAKPASVSGTRVVLFAAALQSTGIAISETSETNVGNDGGVGGDGGDGEAHLGCAGCETDCAYVGNLGGGLK